MTDVASHQSSPRTLAVIGLGHMGMPIAERLLGAGFEVHGYDVSPSASEHLAQLDGATAHQRAADAANLAELVILVLPTSTIVEETLERDGVLSAMRSGSLLVDMGSSNPMSSRRLAEQAASLGVRFVDAPVSGGGFRGAQAGTLTIIVGGRDEDVADCSPVFERLGTTIRHVGPVGAGHALKAINNLLSAITLLGSAEALELGVRFGLDPAQMLDVINASSGRSDSTERKLPKFVLTNSYDSGGAMGLMVKDMRNALSLADDLGSPLRLGRFATGLWDAAVTAMSQTADYTEIAKWAEREDSY